MNLLSVVYYPLRWIESEASEKPAENWDKLLLTAIFASVGVWILALSYFQARIGMNSGMLLFWLAVIVVYVPISIRFVSKTIQRFEAIGQVFILAICTVCFSFLRSPTFFRGYDEFLHWRTAFDILQNAHLFSYNSLLPVSPLFPGLEIVTVTLAEVSGLNIVNSGFIVLGASRIIMLVCLFLIFEKITSSVQTAGIATLIYTGSSTFFFFDMAFGYESLALPLAVASVYMMILMKSPSPGFKNSKITWTILICLTLSVIAITHHATSYALIVFMIIWTILDLYVQWQGFGGFDPFIFTSWLTFSSLLWIGTIARITLDYLSPILGGAYKSILGLLEGHSAARHLFQNNAGQSAAIFEPVIGITSVLILCVGLSFGLWQWWLKYRRNSVALTLALSSMVYPVLPLMRLSGGAWEVSNRLSGFIYIALAYTVALGMREFPLPTRFNRIRKSLAVLSIAIIVIGGIVGGSSPQTRLPLPYLPAAESRSIDNEVIDSAEWARNVLGPNNKMVGDRTLTTLMGAYGTQRMVSSTSDNVSISGLFLHYNITEGDIKIIKEAKIRFLVIDRRIANEVPILGYYFEDWEQLIVEYVPPINISALEKFDSTKNVSRIYDSGNIVIYDIGALQNAP